VPVNSYRGDRVRHVLDVAVDRKPREELNYSYKGNLSGIDNPSEMTDVASENTYRKYMPDPCSKPPINNASTIHYAQAPVSHHALQSIHESDSGRDQAKSGVANHEVKQLYDELKSKSSELNSLLSRLTKIVNL